MRIEITGMHCQGCVERVRKALEKVEGARVERVDVGSAEVAIDAQGEQRAIEAIRKAGYEARRT